MYMKVHREDTVRIPPDMLGVNIEEVIDELTHINFEGKMNHEGQMTILTMNVVRVGEGRIAHGDAGVYQNVTFDALVFKPVMYEVVWGTVCEVLKYGVFVRIGPLDGLLHISQLMDDHIDVDLANERLVGKESKRDVRVGDRCYIGHGAILRGDYGTIEIGDGSAIEEGVVIHAPPQETCRIGEKVTVGHGAIVHSKSIGGFCLIGMGAILSVWSEIGERSIIAEGTLVKKEQKFPGGVMVGGNPARIVREVSAEDEKRWERGLRLAPPGNLHAVGESIQFGREICPAPVGDSLASLLGEPDDGEGVGQRGDFVERAHQGIAKEEDALDASGQVHVECATARAEKIG